MKRLINLALFLMTLIGSSAMLAEDIECPDAKECFDCWVHKVAADRVKFEFTRSPTPGHNWTPITMVAAYSAPIADTKKATPDLEVRYPIQLAKDTNGDWVITCEYLENGKYGGHVGYVPTTTLTIKKDTVKNCEVKSRATIRCI